VVAIQVWFLFTADNYVVNFMLTEFLINFILSLTNQFDAMSLFLKIKNFEMLKLEIEKNKSLMLDFRMDTEV
jgi:hypothetical protein